MKTYRIYGTATQRFYIDIEAESGDEALEAAENYFDASDCKEVIDGCRFEWDGPEEVDEEPDCKVIDGEIRGV